MNGLYYIHKNKLIHRDIKNDNVLITKGGNVVLSDLGCIGQKNNRNYCKTVVGTPRFVANEVSEKGEYDESADIYSLGC